MQEFLVQRVTGAGVAVTVVGPMSAVEQLGEREVEEFLGMESAKTIVGAWAVGEVKQPFCMSY